MNHLYVQSKKAKLIKIESRMLGAGGIGEMFKSKNFQLVNK